MPRCSVPFDSQDRDPFGRRGQLLESLQGIEQRSRTLQNERLSIDDPRGTYYHEAIDKFRAMLAKADPRALAEQAKATSGREDDLIVARLQGLHSEIEQVGEEVRQRQQSVSRLTAHLRSVGTLVNRFRAAGFDSQRAEFDGSVDVTAERRAALEGSIDHEVIWQRLRRSQRWAPPPASRVTQVATHPLTQVLVSAMAVAAAGALQSKARQAAQRRSRSRYAKRR